jgi:hypothetical protein
MSIQLIQQYYNNVDKLIRYGGTRNETSLRKAFQELLDHYARSKNLLLVPEVGVTGKRGRTVHPDGTLKDALRGVPAEAWEYRLGTYSALEWILERYKEKKPKDPTIAEKFNNYRFAHYKEQVIDLLQRVTTVSVETMKIVKSMPS